MSAALVLAASSCSGDSSDEKWNNIELIPVQLSSGGSWSMVNNDGDIVYEDEFKNLPTVAYNGVFSVREDETYALYTVGSKKPELVKDCDNLKQVGYMSDGLIPVVRDGERISLVDKDGAKKFDLTAIDGKEVEECAPGYADGLLRVTLSDGMVTFIDTDGKAAFKNKFSHAFDFSEGLAVVGEGDDNAVIRKVINKKGEVQFKIKEEYSLSSTGFKGGYLSVRTDDDRCVLLDKKGEVRKFPSKITRIQDYDGKYVIFSSNGDWGVADMEGETLIRPKYRRIVFDGTGNFMAVNDRGDQIVRLDKEGEVLQEVDGTGIEENAGKFGIIARDHGKYILLDNDGKQKGKEDFKTLSTALSLFSSIESDYFDVEGLASLAVEKVLMENMPATYKLGATSVDINKGTECSYKYASRDVDYEAANVDNKKYRIQCNLVFSEDAAKYVYNDGSYSGSYQWNPDARLFVYRVKVTGSDKLNEEFYKAVIKTLEAKGFKVDHQGAQRSSNATGAILKKGNTDVLLSYDNKYNNSFYLTYFDGNEQVLVAEAYGYFENAPAIPQTSQAEESAQAQESGSDDYRQMVAARKLTADDLKGYTKAQLRIMRNTVYAMHGRKFASKDLSDHFSKYDWYKPTKADVSVNELNEIERHNVALIQKYE